MGIGEREYGVFADPEASKALIVDVFNVLSAPPYRWSGVRFNFVGGEPALLKDLPVLVEYCRLLGARVSFVSNGLMLRRFDAEWISRNIDIIGLSVDSVSDETNIRIGRATRTGRPFDFLDLVDRVREIRDLRRILLKVNTVVSRANVGEDLSSALRMMTPDKWKIFRMLPVYGSADAVTSVEFQDFVQRHAEFSDILVSEDNHEMANSYLMIDPVGRFFWTNESATNGYQYSRRIPDIGAQEALWECVVSWEGYSRRYRDGVI